MKRLRRELGILFDQAGDGEMSFAKMMGQLSGVCMRAGGGLGLALRGGLNGSRQKLAPGISPTRIFPLPLPRASELLGAGLADFNDDMLAWLNLTLAAINLLQGGRAEDCWTRLAPSAAQRRIWLSVGRRVQEFEIDAGSWPTLGQIRDLLRLDASYEVRAGGSLPLGTRGGVPPRAGAVDLAGVLEKRFPELAAQVREPKLLLLRARERPKKIRQPFVRLDVTYKDLVYRNVSSGLQRLVPESAVWKHAGRTLKGGGFAVAKDAVEDRTISDLPINALLDPRRLPRPVFAYTPRLRAMRTQKGTVLKVRKRDARHYFHQLRLGRRWHKYLAHPSIKVDGKLLYPLHQVAPMGFAPSAGWAQGVTDTVTADADLPACQRVCFSEPLPASLPVWGSILDDVWTIEENAKACEEDPVAKGWVQAVDDAWPRTGAEINIKKNVDGAFAEIQGTVLHPVRHWLGAAVERRVHAIAGALLALARPRIARKTLQRLTGLHGYAHTFRTELRSVFGYVYYDDPNRTGTVPPRHRAEPWHPEAAFELLISSVLLPLATRDLDAEWCPRVALYDASPGGHGRAWGDFAESFVAGVARRCDQRAPETSLTLEYGIAVDQMSRCALHRVHLPQRAWWASAARPGGYNHITLEEAAAGNWSLEARLTRAGECGTRCLEGGDNAATVGAFLRGRSRSPALNAYCRRRAAIALAGNLNVFDFWVPTALNPADGPSSVFGIRAGGGDSERYDVPQPLATSEYIPPSVQQVSCRALLLSCGARREDSLEEQMRILSSQHGILIFIEAWDPAIDPCLDLAQWEDYCVLERRALAGEFQLAFGSPPCSMVSRARHRPRVNGGPRPVYGRSDPFAPLPGCTPKEVEKASLGAYLFLAVLNLLGAVAAGGGVAGLEQPKDPGQEPYPSYLHSTATDFFRNRCGAIRVDLDQCNFGAPTRKPTTLLWACQDRFSKEAARRLKGQCRHGGRHPALEGFEVGGGYRTTRAARYPRELAAAIGGVLVDHAVRRCQRNGPGPQRGARWSAPWRHRLLPLVRAAAGNAGALLGFH